MAQSGIEVDLANKGFETSLGFSQTSVWSLGCDITIEEVDADIQEIRLADIILTGEIATNEISVDIDAKKANVMDLDVNVTVDGISSSIVESQVVPYDRIIGITDGSKESTNETRYASSALASKKLYDLITSLGLENISGVAISNPMSDNLLVFNGHSWVNLTAKSLFDKYGTGGSGSSGDSFWYMGEDGKVHIDYDIYIAGNATITGDTASGGEGSENAVIGATSIVVNGTPYPAVDGVIDLSNAFEGLQVDIDLSDYYTKDETNSAINSAIAGIDISKYATKDDLQNLDTKYSPVKTWYDNLGSLIIRDGDNVRIKTNIIIEGDTSSGGESSGEVVIGTTSIIVDGVSYPSKDGVIDLSKAFEGLQVEIDLSNYATKGDVTNAISNLNIDQYATDDELSQVSGRVTTLESYFSTSEDADTQINKWNEIVAFLNATEGTTLAGILAAYYTKTEVDGKVTAINNSITALDDKYAPVKTWYDALASLIVKDGTNVRIKTNLIVEGDTASGGTGGGAAIGVTGILVDGKQYTDTDSDGYIDLSGAFAGLSPTITSAMITEALGYTPANSASLGSLAYLNSLSKSDVGLGNVDNLAASGYLTALSSDTTNAVSITVGGTTKNITVTAMKTSLGLGSLATKDSLVASDIPFLDWSKITSGKPTTLSGYGITDAYTASATDTKLSGYLPLTGGTLSANGSDIFVINRLNSTSPTTITYRKDGSLLGRMGFNTDGAPVAQVGGTYQTLIHSGNVGEYAFLKSATKLTSSDTLDADLVGLYSYQDGNNPTNSFGNNAALLSFKGTKANPTFQLAFAGNEATIGYKVKTTSGTWQPWKTIAFTDSNVASATKLATARTIWGQSFDGTGNVSGNLTLANDTPIDVTLVSGITASVLYLSSANVVQIGYGTALIGADTIISGENLQLRYSTSRKVGLLLNSSGNVGIGTTSPAYKLDVNGTGRFTDAVTMASSLSVGGASTFNGDVRINGNLVVTGDTASGGTGENNVGGNLRVDYDAMWALINKTSITQAEMDAVGFTTEVVDNITIGVYNKIVGESGAYKYVYNYECRDLDGSIHLHIYFGDDNIDNCERFYFERSDAGTWTLNFYEV